MASDCAVCDLGPAIVLRIHGLLTEGEDKSHVAMLFGVSVDQLSAHMDGCVKPPRSRAERCKEICDELESAVSLAFNAMTSNTRGLAGLQQGYARLVSEYREALEEYAELQKPEDMANEIMDRVMNPLIREIVKVAAEEMDIVKSQMIQYNISREISSKIIEESFKRQTVKLKAAAGPAVQSLSKYLGVKRDEDIPDTKDTLVESTSSSASKSGLN
jgi:hypothetical protein